MRCESLCKSRQCITNIHMNVRILMMKTCQYTKVICNDIYIYNIMSYSRRLNSEYTLINIDMKN